MSDQAPEQSQAPELSIEQRLARVFGAEDKPAPEPKAPEPAQVAPEPAEPPAAEGQAPAPESDEPSVDDLPDEVAQPEAQGEIELTYNGSTRRVPIAEAKELAQKGFDYTQKTQQLAEERTRLQQYAQALQQTATLQTALMDDVAEAKALQRELARFPKSAEEWLAKSQEDPIGAFQLRTQHDTVMHALQAKVAQIQTKGQQVQQAQAAISDEQLRAEFDRARASVPAWSDSARFKADAEGIKAYLLTQGYSAQEADAIYDGRTLVQAWKAWQYDRLLKGKAEKLKQVRQAPPVVKPGSAGTAQSASQQRYEKERAALKKSGDVRDAARVLARIVK